MAANTAAARTAAAVRSDPDFGGGLVLVLRIEGDDFLGQNHVVRSHGGLQEDVEPDLVGEAKQLQQHRLHGVQPQRQRRRYQISGGGATAGSTQ